MAEKLEQARAILIRHGHYDWLTRSGKFEVPNKGMEFAVTYLLMLLALFQWCWALVECRLLAGAVFAPRSLRQNSGFLLAFQSSSGRRKRLGCTS
ncbi:hypothetical protein [Pseudomonas cavernicola]|uniref:hypothetical protein n=1 Tax=Pseudomonas cavernicola TaxID=2320866 RepID=UPI001EE5FA82|nr:hypothetical protein [Pseudomonas cavernicola]